MHAFLFPGQGSQRKGMGEALFPQYPELIRQAEQVLGYSIEEICLSDNHKKLDFTLYSQPAIYIVNALSYLDSLRQGMAIPDVFAGHSLGEFNALLAAGAFDFITGLKLVKKRAELMSELSGGAMAAVIGLHQDQLEKYLAEEECKNLCIANHNTATQFVVSGPKAEIERLNHTLKDDKDTELFHVLKTSGAFHSRYMGSAEIEFAKFIEGFNFEPLNRPVIANVTAEAFHDDVVKVLLPRQITSRVLWFDSVQTMRRKGVDRFTEASGSRILTNMVDKICQQPLPQPITPPAPAKQRADQPLNSQTTDTGSVLLTLLSSERHPQEERVVQSFRQDDRWQTVSRKTLSAKAWQLGDELIRTIPAQQSAVIFLPQCEGYSQTLFACWYANIIAVPTPATDSSHIQQRYKQLESIVRDSQCRFFITNDDFEQAIKPLARNNGIRIINIDRLFAAPYNVREAKPRAPASPADVAMLLYTSGSTADPKGVVISHQGLYHAATSPLWGYHRDSRIVSWLPQHHAFGLLYTILAPLAQGSATFILSTERFISEPELWFRLIDDVAATHSGMSNFAFGHMLRHVDAGTVKNLNLSSLISLSCAGDIISHSAYMAFCERFSATGLRPGILSPNYGMSEAAPLTQKPLDEPFAVIGIAPDSTVAGEKMTLSSAENHKRVISCGVATADTRIIIVDPERMEICPPLTPGEIWVKSSCQGLGYFNNPQASEKTFNNCHPVSGEKGYLRTGDLGFMQDDNLYLTGRLKETIIINGKKYYPTDLEMTLRDAIPGCEWPCVVFAVSKQDNNHIIVVQEIDADKDNDFYQAAATAIVAVLSRHLSLHVADIVFIPPGGLPLTGSRKVQRNRSRDYYLSQQFDVLWQSSTASAASQDMPPLTDSAIEDRLTIIVRDETQGFDSLPDLNTDFSSLGLDSISYIRIAARINKEFAVTSFKTGLFLTYRNIAQLAAYLATQAQPRPQAKKQRQYEDYQDAAVLTLIDSYQSKAISLGSLINKIKEGV